MSWQVFFSPSADKQFGKLGRPAQKMIEHYIATHLEGEEDPRRFGKPFLSLKGAWRYRVGDYRLVCVIRENELVVLVVKVGHRRDIYSS